MVDVQASIEGVASMDLHLEKVPMHTLHLSIADEIKARNTAIAS